MTAEFEKMTMWIACFCIMILENSLLSGFLQPFLCPLCLLKPKVFGYFSPAKGKTYFEGNKYFIFILPGNFAF